jgi:hypothetical protein
MSVEVLQANQTSDISRRYFVNNDNGGSDMEQQLSLNVPNIINLVGSKTALIAAIDIDEDGKLDIICQTQSNSDSSIYDLQFIYNNQYLDSFFLKGLVVFEHEHTETSELDGS